jgi:hypothetical protein
MSMKRVNITYIIAVFVMQSMMALHAQEPYVIYLDEDLQERTADIDQWEKIISDIDYTEASSTKEKQEEKGDERQSRYDNIRNRRRPAEGGNGLGKALLIFTLITIAIVGIILLARNLLGLEVAPRDKKLKKKAVVGGVDMEDIEANIHESDLESFIDKALAEKKYALAVRLHYLLLLKELSAAGLIRWKRDKTNRQYLRELSQTPLATDFFSATRIFELAWYSDYEIDEAGFKRIEPEFKAIVEQVRRQR